MRFKGKEKGLLVNGRYSTDGKNDYGELFVVSKEISKNEAKKIARLRELDRNAFECILLTKKECILNCLNYKDYYYFMIYSIHAY